MKKWYTTISIVSFNSIVAIVLFLGLLWVALEGRHLVTGRGHVVISDSILFESFGLTSIEKATATALEFDSYASQQPFVFNPWTTFMLAPVVGKNLNVIADPIINHRIDPANGDHSNHKNKEVITVWGFGGSTLYGFGVPDGQTIISHLKRTLGDLDRSRLYRIVNFGQPYWFSGVEVAGYSALLRSGRKPDIVLFLDGHNDMSNLVAGRTVPYFAARASAAWERSRSNDRRLLPWLSINQSFPLTRIFKFVESQTNTTPTAETSYRKNKTMTSDDVVRVYHYNIKMAKALSDAFGIRSYFFLQPVPWFGNYEAKTVRSNFPFGRRSVAVEAYERIISSFEKRSDSFSLHNVLYDQESPFVDRFHYSDTSNKLLAEKIANVILRSIE